MGELEGPPVEVRGRHGLDHKVAQCRKRMVSESTFVIGSSRRLELGPMALGIGLDQILEPWRFPLGLPGGIRFIPQSNRTEDASCVASGSIDRHRPELTDGILTPHASSSPRILFAVRCVEACKLRRSVEVAGPRRRNLPTLWAG